MLKKKRIAARRFAYRYLILIIILTVIIIGIIYTTYAFYFSLGTIILILYILARQPRLIYYVYRLLKWIYSPFTSKYKTWNQGARGEEIVAKYLEELGKDYLIINDIVLPEEKGNIDHIVIGKSGIFIIETKTHKGHISCDSDFWRQEKLGRGGTWYEGKIGSPSKQVKRKTIVLRKFFERYFPELSKVWINGVVVFVNEGSSVEAINPTVPVLKPEQLVEFIKNNKSNIKIPKKDISKLKILFKKIELN